MTRITLHYIRSVQYDLCGNK